MHRLTFRSQLSGFLVGEGHVESDGETAAVLEMDGGVHGVDEPVLLVQTDVLDVDPLQRRRLRAHFNIENLRRGREGSEAKNEIKTRTIKRNAIRMNRR